MKSVSGLGTIVEQLHEHGALLIAPDGTVTPKPLPAGRKFQLDELQALVGGYIELAPSALSRFRLVLNEEGLQLNLPPNRLATALMHPRTLVDGSLVGPVLIARSTML